MKIGFDFSQFTQLIKQVEELGADRDEVAEHVLDAGSEPARQTFADNIPFDEGTPESRHPYKHAKDTVTVSGTRIAKRSRNKFRLIEPKTNKVDPKTGKLVPYLYYREYGSTKASAKPWHEKASKAARDAAIEPMKKALVDEIEKRLR